MTPAKRSRKVQSGKGKAAAKAPRKAAARAKAAPARPAGGPAAGAPKGPAGMAARLAAMAAASAELEGAELPGGGRPAAPAPQRQAQPEPQPQPASRAGPKAGPHHGPHEPHPGHAKRVVIDDPAPTPAARPAAAAGAVPAAPAARAAPVAVPAPATAGARQERDGDDGSGVVKGGKGHLARMEVGDGVQVVSRKASSISEDMLAELKKAIVVKGSGRVVGGINLDDLKYDQEGLVAVVAQDKRTGAILMQGWANKETLEQSLTARQMTYWNRSRGKPFKPGEERSQPQRIADFAVDCDKDAVLVTVEQDGAACHLDNATCWSAGKEVPVPGALGRLDRSIARHAKEKPKGSAVAGLAGDPKRAGTQAEAAASDFAKAVGKGDAKEVAAQAADAIRYVLVAARSKGVGLAAVLAQADRLAD